MADEDFLTVDVNYKALMKELESYNEQIPNIARKLMRAVNNEAKKQIRREARARGYTPQKVMEGKTGSYNSGYSKNLKSYANRDFSGKIMMTKNAFYYRFIEYGAKIPERTIHVDGKSVKLKGFSYPAKPLIYPITNSIWGTEKGSQIMESVFQKELDKLFKED